MTPYDQSGRVPHPPNQPAPVDPEKGFAFVVAILATLILGPLADNYTTPYMEPLFLKLYGPDWQDLLTSVWGIGMFALVGFLAHIFVYRAVLVLIAYLSIRFFPAAL